MPALLIHIVNGNWAVEVANTDIIYNFEGATLEEQAEIVHTFAQTLANGDPDVVWLLDDGDIDAEELSQQLFSTTDMIIYNDQIIYGAVGEECIIDDLELAGEALLAAL
jgi:hypothetical protein